INPSYAPGAGRLPVSETVTSWRAPAERVTLLWLTVTRALESLESCRTARENVAAAELTLVRVRVRLTGSTAGTGPKEIAAGSNVTGTFTASAALSLPAPASVTCTPPARSEVAVLTTADFRRPGCCFKFGLLASAMAATPAANGTA